MTFKEYYQYYLTLHQNKWNRRLHILGQFLTLLYITSIIYLIITYNFLCCLLLIFTPFIVYPFAWSGHFFIEKNKPAAFKNPLWAKACDWIMLKDVLVGKISFWGRPWHPSQISYNLIMLKVLFLSAIFLGIIRGIMDMQEVRKNPYLGVKPSQNLLSYLFIDNW